MRPGPAGAAARTNRHYDLPAAVFAAFLGRRMKYTCGLYAGEDSLDEAQERKLRFVAAQLALTGGERVLDIGAGWGALTFFLAEELGCQITALTPSGTQTAHLREQAAARGLDHLVRVEQRSVYDLDATARYHAVALVGVAEHLPELPPALALVRRVLRREGRLYLSASCFRDQATYTEYAARPASRHVTEEVFGFGVLRPLSVLVQAVEEAGLSLAGLTDLTGQYRRTIQDWQAGLHAHRDRVDAAGGPGLAAELLRYLETTNAGWGHTTKHYALVAARSRLGWTPEATG